MKSRWVLIGFFFLLIISFNSHIVYSACGSGLDCNYGYSCQLKLGSYQCSPVICSGNPSSPNPGEDCHICPGDVICTTGQQCLESSTGANDWACRTACSIQQLCNPSVPACTQYCECQSGQTSCVGNTKMKCDPQTLTWTTDITCSATCAMIGSTATCVECTSSNLNACSAGACQSKACTSGNTCTTNNIASDPVCTSQGGTCYNGCCAVCNNNAVCGSSIGSSCSGYTCSGIGSDCSSYQGKKPYCVNNGGTYSCVACTDNTQCSGNTPKQIPDQWPGLSTCQSRFTTQAVAKEP